MSIDKNENTSDSNPEPSKALILLSSAEIQERLQLADPGLREVIYGLQYEILLLSDRMNDAEAMALSKLKEERRLTVAAMRQMRRRLFNVGYQVAALAVALFGAGALWTHLSDDQKQEMAGSFYRQFVQDVTPVASAAIAGVLLYKGHGGGRDRDDEDEEPSKEQGAADSDG